MPPLARSLVVALALSAVLPGAALAQGGGPAPAPQPGPPPPPLIVQKPSPRGILIKEGWTDRFLLGGQWYFRQDDALVGDQSGFATQPDLSGWTPIRVPFNWNATDTTQNRPSVGWYRKEFQVPKTKRRVNWKVRFQGNNYRSFVFLNGKLIGRFGGYFPFEVDLKNLKRGRNTLVVKVSSLRSSSDLTHWRPAAFNGFGTGGWWNFGGILREVYMRPVDTVDIEQVRALPKVPRLGGPAKVRVKMVVRNLTPKKRAAAIAIGIRGGPSTTMHRDVSPGRNELAASLTIQRPRLWQPGRPFLYGMRIGASTKGKRRSTYALAFGVKKLERRGSVALLNGHKLQLRGASIHEDDPVNGGALSPSNRSQIVRRMRQLHATVARSHYPLHPATLEAFDRAGILDWTQTPVYQLPNALFNQRGVRAAAQRAVNLTVRGNANHASIFVWSLVNEPAGNVNEFGKFGPGLRTYIRQGARNVKRLDDTRWVAIDHQSRLGEPLKQSSYRYLDVLGVNEYMGWYKSVKQGLSKPVFSSTKDLSPYLDRLHRANPRLPFFITEYGAEGSRHGPKGQKGSYEFQSQYTLEHLKIHASKRYVNGSIVWALKDFRVDPTWLGGAPPEWGTPPWHNKSLIEQSGQPKPIFGAIKRRWARTRAFRR